MKKKKRIITASVTLIAAAATAHLMQRGSDDIPRMSSVTPAEASVSATAVGPTADVPPQQIHNPVQVVTKPGTVALEAAEPTAEALSGVTLVAAADHADPARILSDLDFPAMPSVPSEALMPAPLPSHGPELASRMSTGVANPVEPAQAAPVPEVKRNEFGLSCGALLTASPKAAAMVGLTLTDPCRGEEIFTLKHGEMTFTARLNTLGTYMGDIPALMTDAVFTARFQDGSEVETDVVVPSADQIDRVALFGIGQQGLEIHALEFGADYGKAGHIWSGNASDADRAMKMGGGFITLLGDTTLPEPRLAQVYTFPVDSRLRTGVVRLSIEAEVTAFNCGKDIAGQTLQKQSGLTAAPVSLTLAMPDCDAIGEFLVLKNLLRDLKIALN